ncbi:MAG: HAD family hydrolase [Myxococcota bacterium]
MADSSRSPLVVFDFDGTLADTWRDIARALNRTLTAAGLEPALGHDVRFWIGDGARRLLERAVPPSERTPEAIDALYAIFADHYEATCLETTEPYPGVVECLDSLRAFPLAIASNKPERFLGPIVEGLGLKAHFRVIAGGDTLRVRKPDPGVLAEIAERVGGGPWSPWMVGDSAVDVQTGRAAGAHTIGCAWGLRGRAELQRAGAEYLVEEPAEICRLIGALR